VSTFYAYFESKEATAFPDEDARAALVAGELREPPTGETLHETLRRASHAIVERDLNSLDKMADRVQLLAREPALAAHAVRLQAGYADEFATVLADQTGVDPAIDLRPRLAISAAMGALNAAWAAWAADDSRSLPELVDEAHDILDAGFAKPSAPLPLHSDDEPTPPRPSARSAALACAWNARVSALIPLTLAPDETHLSRVPRSSLSQLAHCASPGVRAYHAVAGVRAYAEAGHRVGRVALPSVVRTDSNRLADLRRSRR
jgi:AcrR family transcriptional regulator